MKTIREKYRDTKIEGEDRKVLTTIVKEHQYLVRILRVYIQETQWAELKKYTDTYKSYLITENHMQKQNSETY